MVGANPDSALIMGAIDAFPPELRALVYEYGFNIVVAMTEEGAPDLAMLRWQLETWRNRRQEQILSTDHHIDRARMLAIASRYRAPRRHRGRARHH